MSLLYKITLSCKEWLLLIQVAELFTAARIAVKNTGITHSDGRQKDVTLFTVKGSHIGFGALSFLHTAKACRHMPLEKFNPYIPESVLWLKPYVLF